MTKTCTVLINILYASSVTSAGCKDVIYIVLVNQLTLIVFMSYNAATISIPINIDTQITTYIYFVGTGFKVRSRDIGLNIPRVFFLMTGFSMFYKFYLKTS
jgi:hypothetical protein